MKRDASHNSIRKRGLLFIWPCSCLGSGKPEMMETETEMETEMENRLSYVRNSLRLIDPTGSVDSAPFIW